MNDISHGFRDKLIATEPVNHDLQLNYEREMEKMFTDEIKGVRRIGWWANYLAMLVFGLALLASALFNQPISLPAAGRWLWGLSAAFVLTIALAGMKTGWNRKMDLRKDSKLMAGIGSAGMTIVAFVVLFVAFLSGDVENFLYLAPIAMLIIIMGMLVSVMDKVQQGELNTRENLLEIKYTLAQLEERLGGGKKE